MVHQAGLPSTALSGRSDGGLRTASPSRTGSPETVTQALGGLPSVESLS